MNTFLADSMDSLNSILAALCLVMVTFTGVGMMLTSSVGFGLLVLILGFVGTVLIFGFMAVMLDIRTELKTNKPKYKDPNKIERPFSK
jgi:TM2 domain-containing membrane protein YozV